ncbi:hypothetical protein [Zhihengliuella halotolerans]|uniref:Uncharacterized protein n=1 Tax=Zhihengliuella halotolerans TaxID=370736 RepID=A0A4Q8AF34_9MICC|nr:hypothetical protein [Zhihengliuella halotolerans]RZU62219.1 hypothetical protein EV380_1810 [Zhihengliuella halotolerans]
MSTQTEKQVGDHRFADHDFGSEDLEREHLDELKHHAEDEEHRKEAAAKTGFDEIHEDDN